MAIREILNPTSAFGQMAYGASSMGVSYLPLAQSTLADGYARYGMNVLGAASFGIGAVVVAFAVHTIFNHVRRGRLAQDAPASAGIVQAFCRSASIQLASAELQRMKEQRDNRLLDGMAAAGIALAATQLPPAAGGPVLQMACGAYALGCAAGISWNTMRIGILRHQLSRSQQPG